MYIRPIHYCCWSSSWFLAIHLAMKALIWVHSFIFSLALYFTYLSFHCSFLNVPFLGHCWSICPSYRYGFKHSDLVLINIDDFVPSYTVSLCGLDFFCLIYIYCFFYHFRLMKSQQLEQTPLYYWGILQATWTKGSVSTTNQFYNFIGGYASLNLKILIKLLISSSIFCSF